MKYAKPEVVAVKSALEAIATIVLDKTQNFVSDRNPHNSTLSAGAYEADE
jgi:hypothetical protein